MIVPVSWNVPLAATNRPVLENVTIPEPATQEIPPGVEVKVIVMSEHTIPAFAA